MLKLYTDTSFLSDEHRKTVFPLLFDMHFEKSEKILCHYVLTDSIVDCNIVVFPIDYARFINFENECRQLLQLAKKNDKPIWLYTAGDYGFTNYIKNSYTFRLGGFDSLLKESTVILPSFIKDPYCIQLPQYFYTIKRENRPNIGFVGHAQSGLVKYLKELLNHSKYKLKRNLNLILTDKQEFYPSSIKRAKYLRMFQLSDALNTNFILRKNYRGGAQNESEKQKTTQEFYDNIFNNAYTFCSRGVGNFSVRFYETLAVGRIPIVLNTDCRFPLSHIIDWNKHCIILEETKKESFEDQILNFHNALTQTEFEALQSNNRDLWNTYLSRIEFFINIHNIFIAKKSNNE